MARHFALLPAAGVGARMGAEQALCWAMLWAAAMVPLLAGSLGR